MANFNFNIIESDFEVSLSETVSTECASQYFYSVNSTDGNSVNIELSGDWITGSYYEMNGVKTNWNGSLVSVTISGTLTIKFSIENSGIPGLFLSADLNVNDTTLNLTSKDTQTRENDSIQCDNPDGEARTYDMLFDTPSDKIGSSLKLIRVSSDESKHEYLGVKDILNLTEDDINADLTGNILTTKSWVQNGGKVYEDLRIQPTPFYEEDFSSGLGDFTTSGDSAWTVVSDEGNGDLFSARSGAIVDNNYTKMTINRTLSSETTLVKFDYKTSTESDFDFLMVTANGVRRKYSGETDWTTASFYIHGSGSQDISFTYVKDTGTTSGQDFVWIDNFSLTNDVEPFIFNSKVLFNEELNFKESVSFKEDVFFNNEISITGRSLSFLDENNEVTTSMSSVGQNSYLQASVNMINSWALTANPGYNRFQINKDNGSEGIKIQFDKSDTLFPEGFMHIPVTAFQFRLGEFAGNDTDIIFVANGKGIFREKLKVEDAIESYGETSNKETLASGTYNVDWETLGNHDITLTENTTITETNIPQVGISKTITMYVTGEFTLTLPAGWVVSNGVSYVGDVRTQIVIQSWDNGNYETVIN